MAYEVICDICGEPPEKGCSDTTVECEVCFREALECCMEGGETICCDCLDDEERRADEEPDIDRECDNCGAPVELAGLCEACAEEGAGEDI